MAILSSRIGLYQFLEATKKVPFRIILSHATREEDNETCDVIFKATYMGLYNKVPPYRSYILGGHDHDIDWIEGTPDEYLSWTIPRAKNLANLQTVRVILLFAGGFGEVSKIVRDEDLQRVDMSNSNIVRISESALKNNNNPELSWRRRDKPLTKYPDDLSTLLNDIHPRDAEEFRKFFESEEFKNKWATVTDYNYDPDYSLAAAFDLLPRKTDILSFLLRYEDHENADANDLQYVKNILKIIEKPGDNDIVFDFSAGNFEDFDAREISIRSVPTNFGFSWQSVSDGKEMLILRF